MAFRPIYNQHNIRRRDTMKQGWYKNVIYTGESGVLFERSFPDGLRITMEEQEDGILVIRECKNIPPENRYSKLFDQPPVPNGFTHVTGIWKDGYVIESSKTGSQYVWVPVGWLDDNGTLDDIHFDQKFGRRRYLGEHFSSAEYHETMTKELQEQVKSVRTYGGFYIARYDTSISKETGQLVSVKQAKPLINMNFEGAKQMAKMLEEGTEVTSHLCYGAEYDSVLEWLIKTKKKFCWEIVSDSTEWGNYLNAPTPNKLMPTGSEERFSACRLYDLSGNIDEWTQEQYSKQMYTIRGGNYKNNGSYSPVAKRHFLVPEIRFQTTGFRVALCIR